MSNIKWIIFAVATIGLLATLVIISQGSKLDVSAIDTGAVQKGGELNGGIGDNRLNNSDSKVIFIEYGDFQCPGCGQAYPRIKALTEEYGDRIEFIFRNLPLVQNHPNAKAAASAAEAAGLQGKYWQMHDMLFEKQNDWGLSTPNERTSIFVSYASLIGIDLEKFKADLSSKEVSNKIAFDLALAAKDNLTSTPSFMLNGVALEQSVWANDTALRELIDAELAKNTDETNTDTEETSVE